MPEFIQNFTTAEWAFITFVLGFIVARVLK